VFLDERKVPEPPTSQLPFVNCPMACDVMVTNTAKKSCFIIYILVFEINRAKLLMVGYGQTTICC
jgi:hypothetical protein